MSVLLLVHVGSSSGREVVDYLLQRVRIREIIDHEITDEIISGLLSDPGILQRLRVVGRIPLRPLGLLLLGLRIRCLTVLVLFVRVSFLSEYKALLIWRRDLILGPHFG